MRSEEEVKEAIDELTKLETDFNGTMLAEIAAIAKRRLTWVLGD